jgi:hypothetical protein
MEPTMTKSPFPGMDPYLEQVWRDVHQKLCVYACDDIQSQLGAGMHARVDERLVIELPADAMRSIYPDVRVVAKRSGNFDPQPAGGVMLADPIPIETTNEPVEEGFIQIIDTRSGGRVITVIEFLSPTNKFAGPAREQYIQKQGELRNAGVSLVEINLLRCGQWVAQVPIHKVPTRHLAPYYAVVHRSWGGSRYEYYPMPMRHRLSAIGIPVRLSDPLIALDLQSLIDRVYRNGAYGTDLDYTTPPVPELESEDATWAGTLLREAGFRK